MTFLQYMRTYFMAGLLASLAALSAAQESSASVTPLSNPATAFAGCLMAVAVGTCTTARTPSECEAAIDAATLLCSSLDPAFAPVISRAISLKEGEKSLDNEVNGVLARIAAVKENLLKLRTPAR